MLEGYDYFLSELFLIPNKNESFEHEGSLAKDSLFLIENAGHISNIYLKNSHIIDSNKYREYKNITFLLNVFQNLKKRFIFLIGFSSEPKNTSYSWIFLLSQLKKLSYIDSTLWSIKFNKKQSNEGNIIIGSNPHEYDFINYYEVQLYKTLYNKKNNTLEGYYVLNFEKFYLSFDNDESNTKFEKWKPILSLDFINQAYLEFNVHFIHLPFVIFGYLIKKYLIEYLENKICFF